MSLDIIAAAARHQVERYDPPARRRCRQRPFPVLPRSVAVDLRRHRPLRPEHRAEQTARGGIERARNVEPVAIGRGIESEREQIAAGGPHIGNHERTAIADVGFRVELATARLARHCITNRQPVDRQSPDVNIEFGEDRPLFTRGHELGQAAQSRCVGRQAGDVEAIVEPGARRPVERHVGAFEKHAARIRDAQVAEAGLVPDRAFDAADLKPQPRCRAQRFDPVDQETVADAAIGNDQERARNKHQREQDAADPFERTFHRPHRSG